MEHICKNCGTSHFGSFCNNCGQKVIDKRFTVRSLYSNSISAVFNLDKGLLFTFYNVLIHPHKVVSEYISGITKKYTNPAKFAIYLIGFATLIIIRKNIIDTNINDFNNLWGYENDARGLQLQKIIMEIIKNNLQYFQLFFIPFFAMTSRWFFRVYNYAEHLILHGYVFSFIMLITTVLTMFFGRFSVTALVPFVFTIVFYSITFLKLFRNSIFVTILKSLAIYLIAYFIIIFIVTATSMTYLVILKSKGLL